MLLVGAPRDRYQGEVWRWLKNAGILSWAQLWKSAQGGCSPWIYRMQEVYKMNPQEARYQLVETYRQTGSLAQTARLWQTSRAVVRTWVRRFQSEGEAGLVLFLQ